jgi:hypothetical protein
MDDGRKTHIIRKALAIPIFAIEQAPERFRAHSDFSDMKELLGGRPYWRKIEDLDALRADGAGELPIAANGVLSGDPALLASDRAEGDVGRPVEEAVVCFNAGRFVCMRRVTAIALLVPSFAPALRARSLLGRTPLRR